MRSTAAPTAPRQPKFAPESRGGQFVGPTLTDFAGQLHPGMAVLGTVRTTFTGYELRKYRVLGHGPAGVAWTATIYREGKQAVVVTDSANGDGPDFVALGENMNWSAKEMAAFRFLATELFGEGKDSAEKFAACLKLSADIDAYAKTNGISRPEAVWDHVQSEEIEAREAPLYINGYLE